MRILLIHNKYQVRGGEDKVFEQECELLKKHGHEVETLLVSNDSIQSFIDRLLVAIRVNWSHWGERLVERSIVEFKPEVVHVHNFFPLLSPSIFSVFKKYKIPSVMTLHNYRIICPTATFIIDGQVNEQSMTRSSYRLVFKKFYKNSLLGSFLLARMVEYHKRRGTWKYDVNKFIALTQFARNKFIESGVPDNKIIVKPNFLPEVDESLQCNSRFGALFVGRVSPEKGVDTLLRSWEKINYPLTIAGGGATEDMVKAAPSNVTFLGNVQPEKISDLMKQSSFLVMPSEWFEGFPMVLVEAYFNKLPVIASDIGSLTELIKEGETGLKFQPGDHEALVIAVNKMIKDSNLSKDMGENAYKRAGKLYSEVENYKLLRGIYETVIDDQKV